MKLTPSSLLALQAGTVLAASGSLSFLTANIAGLPAFINNNGVPGDKTTNTARIGQLFGEYGHDIIHVQEDFAYHDTLYANDNHTYRTVTSGNVPFGSGLNTLANYGWTDLQRTTWSQCYISEGDCLTPKGFTYMRMQLPNGASVDVYNLHHDAGSDPKDIEARHANTKQVVDHINKYSVGQAVIVGGDTNSRYTRTGDGIRQFKDLAGLSDAWVELIMGGKAPAEGSSALLCTNPSKVQDCEIVDKVLYRSGDNLDLHATSFRYAGVDYLQPDGNVLTDHDLILVDFVWDQASDNC